MTFFDSGIDSLRYASRAITEQCLANMHDPQGEGAHAFTQVYDEASRISAELTERLHSLGVGLGPLAGMPISVKDLFDIQGEPTLAGSKAMLDAPRAAKDAEIIRRLRNAGAIIVGKTNMTEFAFSGLGLNPHYGTPANPWRRAERRIPGGSSSGAAVSVADGMAVAALGTDTGGSVRIPAAMCGLVGFKPTAQTLPMSGVLPLSTSYDSVGPIANDVYTCALVYAVSAGREPGTIDDIPLSSISLGVAKNYVLDQIDETVTNTYEAALTRLSTAGVRLNDYVFPVFDRIQSIFVDGGLVAAEAYAWHRHLIDTKSNLYDPRVLTRIMRGKDRTFADYVDLLNLRRELIDEGNRQMRRVHAVIMPTVPIVPPRISDLDDDSEFARVNLLVLRNPTVANVLDACSISLPCHEPGQAPVGCMLIAPGGNDRFLFAIALALERVLRVQ